MKLTVLAQDAHQTDPLETFAEDVQKGLFESPKRVPAKYFYDDDGSSLFQKITQHPDYYLTRTEFGILETLRSELPKAISSQPLDIVELGPGDGHKSKLILEGFLQAGRNIRYVPIDISEGAMTSLEKTLADLDDLEIEGIVGEYIQGLRHATVSHSANKLILFLGSNIGNFNKPAALDFLTSLRHVMTPGDFLLMGFDMKKDPAILNRAYNDSDGVTKAFNLNLLKRMNRELKADFDLDRFFHYGVYNPRIGAMESFLISRVEQDVTFGHLGETFHFDAYEPMHLEFSFKFSTADIHRLAEKTGFHVKTLYTDPDATVFADALLVAGRPSQPLDKK